MTAKFHRTRKNEFMTKMRAPSFKMVLTAHGDYVYPYRDTGVLVCPIGCLRG